jgi:homoserine kinase type II
MSSLDFHTVLSAYRLDANSLPQIEPLGNAGGWSGSRLWRLKDAAGRELCLRRWSLEHPTRDRLRLIHSVLSGMAFELPIVAFPLRTAAGGTFVEHEGHLWELTHWLPGKADFHVRPTRPRLRNAMSALAKFHELAARYQRQVGLAPTIDDCRRRMKTLRVKGWALIEQSILTLLGNALDDRRQRLFHLAQQAFARPQLVERLAAVSEVFVQPAIRDIHHDHLLFTGDDVTGIVDFGAMRIDTPLTDIARLIGSLVGDDFNARQFACDAYGELRPLTETDRLLIDLLDEIGLGFAALNWLIWLYVDRRDMGPIEPIARRLDAIIGRLITREQSFQENA